MHACTCNDLADGEELEIWRVNSQEIRGSSVATVVFHCAEGVRACMFLLAGSHRRKTVKPLHYLERMACIFLCVHVRFRRILHPVVIICLRANRFCLELLHACIKPVEESD